MYEKNLEGLIRDLEKKIEKFIENLITDLHERVKPLLFKLQNAVKGKDKSAISSALASTFHTLHQIIEAVDVFLQDNPETKEVSGIIFNLFNINHAVVNIAIFVLDVTQSQLKDENYEASCKKELGNVLNSCKKLLENFVKKDKNVAPQKDGSDQTNEPITKLANSLSNIVVSLSLSELLQQLKSTLQILSPGKYADNIIKKKSLSKGSNNRGF